MPAKLKLVLPHAAQRVVLEDALSHIDNATQRIARLEEHMHLLLEHWRMKPHVAALMGLRGFQTIGAMILCSELGEGWRFAHPVPQLPEPHARWQPLMAAMLAKNPCDRPQSGGALLPALAALQAGEAL